MHHLFLKLMKYINPLNAELNPICHLLALLGVHHILHVSRIRVNTTQIIKCHCVQPFIVLLITPCTMPLHRHFINLHLKTFVLIISFINFKKRLCTSPKLICNMVFAWQQCCILVHVVDSQYETNIHVLHSCMLLKYIGILDDITWCSNVQNTQICNHAIYLKFLWRWAEKCS
jgi:hypothetical protein